MMQTHQSLVMYLEVFLHWYWIEADALEIKDNLVSFQEVIGIRKYLDVQIRQNFQKLNIYKNNINIYKYFINIIYKYL